MTPQLPRRRSAVFRVSTAFTFLALTGWYGYDHVLGTVSNGALTAPIYTVHAPIDGFVTNIAVLRDTAVSEGAILATVTNNTAGSQARDELAIRLEAATAATLRNERRIQETEELLNELTKEVSSYEAAAVTRLVTSVTELDAALRKAEAALDFEAARLARVTRLVPQGNVAAAQVDEVKAAKRQAEADVARLTAARKGGQIELEAARAGTHLSQGYFDTPYSRQRLDQMSMRKQELMQERSALSDQVAELERRLAAELTRTQAIQVDAPAQGVAWELYVAEGTKVSRGSPLVDIATCAEPTIDAAVSETKFGQIRVGDPARIRLTGAPGEIAGHVRSIRTAAARMKSQARSAAAVAPGTGMMVVSIALAPDELAEVGADACHIGRTARVIFENGGLWSKGVQVAERLLMQSPWN